jgi:HEAT repeat protein
MRMQDLDWRSRHSLTKHLARLFSFDQLPLGALRDRSALVGNLAAQMIYELPDGPELFEGLRKLLEAKDCFVRAEVYRLDPTGEFAWPTEDR